MGGHRWPPGGTHLTDGYYGVTSNDGTPYGGTTYGGTSYGGTS